MKRLIDDEQIESFEEIKKSEESKELNSFEQMIMK